MRSMQKARPSTSTKATSDMNPALPSKNFIFSCWCSPGVSSIIIRLSAAATAASSNTMLSMAAESFCSIITSAPCIFSVSPWARAVTAWKHISSTASQAAATAFLFFFTFIIKSQITISGAKVLKIRQSIPKSPRFLTKFKLWRQHVRHLKGEKLKS